MLNDQLHLASRSDLFGFKRSTLSHSYVSALISGWRSARFRLEFHQAALDNVVDKRTTGRVRGRDFDSRRIRTHKHLLKYSQLDTWEYRDRHDLVRRVDILVGSWVSALIPSITIRTIRQVVRANAHQLAELNSNRS